LNQFYKNMMTLAMAMLVLLAIVTFFRSTPEPTNELTYSEFIEKLEKDGFVSVRIQGNEIEGDDQGGETFKAYGPAEDKLLLDLLREKKIKVTYEPREEPGFWQGVLMWWLPMILILGVWFLLFRQIQAGGGKAMSFGKARARLLNENQQRVTFADVSRRGCFSSGLRVRERPCSRARSPARRGSRFSRSRARTSSRCSSASARAAFATSSCRARRTPPASSSSTRSTQWVGIAGPGSAAATTSGSRR
jgi:cell division protease FtsH